MARVLLISTRSLGPPTTGRKIVLRTAVGSLARLGHEVHLACFGADADRSAAEDAARDAGASACYPLPGPSPIRLARSAATQRSWTLNELLWWNPAALEQLRDLVADQKIDFVVADSLRTATYAQRLGVPYFADLDDLLSDRYGRWAQRKLTAGAVMGFRRPTSGLRQRVADRVPAAPLLRFESGRLRRREIEVARDAAGTSLVSSIEADRLAERTGRRIFNLPMAIEVAGRRSWPAASHETTDGPDATPDRRLVFTGSLTWWPNVECVRWWVQEIEPELRRRGMEGYRLHVYGDVPASSRHEVEAPSVVLMGSRPQAQLQTELTDFPFLLVPQKEAMGITTKVIEAAMIGLIVLTTPEGADGMAVENREHLLLWSGVDDLVDQLQWIESQPPADVAALAERGRQWAVATFGPEHVTRRWAEALDASPGLGNSRNSPHSLQGGPAR